MLAHIAIAVDNLDTAATLYEALGFSVEEPEVLERESVRLRKAYKGDLCLELLEPAKPGNGSIAKFLAKRGPGLHHVAMYSDNLQLDLNRLAERGISPLHGYPAPGSAGSIVAFLDPRTTGGVLIELVERHQSNLDSQNDASVMHNGLD